MENYSLPPTGNGNPLYCSDAEVQNAPPPEENELQVNAPLMKSLFEKTKPGWFSERMQQLAENPILGKIPGMGIARALIDPKKAIMKEVTERLDGTASALVKTGIVTAPFSFGSGITVSVLGGGIGLASTGLKTVFLEKDQKEVVTDTLEKLTESVKTLEKAKSGFFQKLLAFFRFKKPKDSPLIKSLQSVNNSLDSLIAISNRLRELYTGKKPNFEGEEMKLKELHDKAKEELVDGLNQTINELVDEASKASKSKEVQELRDLAIEAAHSGIQVEGAVNGWSAVTTQMKLMNVAVKTEAFVRDQMIPTVRNSWNYIKGLL